MSIFFVNLTSDNYPSIDAPLGIYTLKGYLDSNFEDRPSSTILDMQFEPIQGIIDRIIEQKPKILGVSLSIGTLDKLKFLLAGISEILPHDEMPLLVLGKNIPTFATEKLLSEFPSAICVIGEGELAIKDLIIFISGKMELKNVKNIAYIQDNSIKFTERQQIEDLATLGTPYFKDIKKKIESQGNIYIEASRGCHWGKCSFCSGEHYFGSTGSWRHRPIKDIIIELKILKKSGVKKLFFSDEEFFGSGEYGIERVGLLAQSIIDNDIKIKFHINVRCDSIYNKNDNRQLQTKRIAVLQLLKQAGLCNVFLGLESGSMSQLKRYNKGISLEETEKSFRRLSYLDINMSIGFIMFDPLVTKDELKENIDFIRRNNIIKMISEPLNTMRVYNNTGYIKLVRNEERKLNTSLIGSFDLDKASYPVIEYKYPEITIITKITEEFISSSFTFFYAIKSKLRLLTILEAEKYKYLKEYLDKYKELTVDLLYKLTNITGNNVSIDGKVVMEKMYIVKDNLIKEILKNIKERGDIEYLNIEDLLKNNTKNSSYIRENIV